MKRDVFVLREKFGLHMNSVVKGASIKIIFVTGCGSGYSNLADRFKVAIWLF